MTISKLSLALITILFAIGLLEPGFGQVRYSTNPVVASGWTTTTNAATARTALGVSVAPFDPTISNRYNGTFVGNGSGLTNINQSGVVGLTSALSYLTNAAFNPTTATNYNGTFVGNGSGLTNINQSGVVGLTSALSYLTNAAFNPTIATNYNGTFTGNGAGLTNLIQSNVVGLASSLSYLTNAVQSVSVSDLTNASSWNNLTLRNTTNTGLSGTLNLDSETGDVFVNRGVLRVENPPGQIDQYITVGANGALSGDGSGLGNVRALTANLVPSGVNITNGVLRGITTITSNAGFSGPINMTNPVTGNFVSLTNGTVTVGVTNPSTSWVRIDGSSGIQTFFTNGIVFLTNGVLALGPTNAAAKITLDGVNGVFQITNQVLNGNSNTAIWPGGMNMRIGTQNTNFAIGYQLAEQNTNLSIYPYLPNKAWRIETRADQNYNAGILELGQSKINWTRSDVPTRTYATFGFDGSRPYYRLQTTGRFSWTSSTTDSDGLDACYLQGNGTTQTITVSNNLVAVGSITANNGFYESGAAGYSAHTNGVLALGPTNAAAKITVDGVNGTVTNTGNFYGAGFRQTPTGAGITVNANGSRMSLYSHNAELAYLSGASFILASSCQLGWSASSASSGVYDSYIERSAVGTLLLSTNLVARGSVTANNGVYESGASGYSMHTNGVMALGANAAAAKITLDGTTGGQTNQGALVITNTSQANTFLALAGNQTGSALNVIEYKTNNVSRFSVDSNGLLTSSTLVSTVVRSTGNAGWTLADNPVGGIPGLALNSSGRIYWSLGPNWWSTLDLALTRATNATLVVQSNVVAMGTITATNGFVAPSLTNSPPAMTISGAQLWSDGTNLCVIIKNHATGTLTTNKVTMTAWP